MNARFAEAVVALFVEHAAFAKGGIRLTVTSQVCSDKGVCYVSLEQTVRVSLPKSGGRR